MNEAKINEGIQNTTGTGCHNTAISTLQQYVAKGTVLSAQIILSHVLCSQLFLFAYSNQTLGILVSLPAYFNILYVLILLGEENRNSRRKTLEAKERSTTVIFSREMPHQTCFGLGFLALRSTTR